MLATASASFLGSFGFRGGAGKAVFIAQNLHPRVHVSPMTMKVAVPPLQHSAILGQWASWHTVNRVFLLTRSLMRMNCSVVGGFIFSQSGFSRFWLSCAWFMLFTTISITISIKMMDLQISCEVAYCKFTVPLPIA